MQAMDALDWEQRSKEAVSKLRKAAFPLFTKYIKLSPSYYWGELIG